MYTESRTKKANFSTSCKTLAPWLGADTGQDVAGYGERGGSSAKMVRGTHPTLASGLSMKMSPSSTDYMAWSRAIVGQSVGL